MLQTITDGKRDGVAKAKSSPTSFCTSTSLKKEVEPKNYLTFISYPLMKFQVHSSCQSQGNKPGPKQCLKKYFFRVKFLPDGNYHKPFYRETVLPKLSCLQNNSRSEI